MNWDALMGNWTQIRGRIRMHWGKLTDDHLDVIEGRRDLLLGKLQEAYGVTEEEADRQVTAWEDAELSGQGTDAATDAARRTG